MLTNVLIAHNEDIESMIEDLKSSIERHNGKLTINGFDTMRCKDRAHFALAKKDRGRGVDIVSSERTKGEIRT